MGHRTGRSLKRVANSPSGLALLLLFISAPGCMTNYHGRGIQYRIEPQYTVNDPQFLRSMGQLLGPPLVPGNLITGLVNGDRIFPAMLDAVRNAKESINLETYI